VTDRDAEEIDHLVGIRPDEMGSENPAATLLDQRLVS
jgi:hypothetical protein